MTGTGSIRRRLVIQLAAIAALLSVALFLSVRSVAERAAADTQDNVLAASATSIADALYSEGGQIRLELPYSALSMLGTIGQDRVFYRVMADGAPLTGYADLPVAPDAGGTIATTFATLPYRGDDVRFATIERVLSAGGAARRVQITVGQTQNGLAAISAQVTGTATAIGAAFFAVAVTLSLLAAQNALAPLSRLTQSISRRGPNDLRPVETSTAKELVPLVGGLNSFMLRLRSALARSEDLITEAAHRVRTPLATVRTQAEIIHRNMKQDQNRQAVRDMIRALDESSRSAGQLLDHAMVTLRTDKMEREVVDLVALTQDVSDRLSPTADLKDIQVDLILPDNEMPVFGDPILLQNAVHNILDNAIKYSPGETVIAIELTPGAPHRLSVRDEGRGFDGAQANALTQRFQRGQNAGDVVGSGLGLTIVADVVRAHDGTLELSHNPERLGACVSLLLPSV